MKETRFFIQDIAALRSTNKIGTFWYYNPITKLDQDLIYSHLDKLIRIPSMNWCGTFLDFRTRFGGELKYDFFYRLRAGVSGETLEKLNLILKWTKDALIGRDQLIKNLAFGYLAGFQLRHKCYLEAWIDERHPFFDKSGENLNMIFRYQIDLDDDHDSALNYFKRNLLQSLTKVDLLGVAKVKLVYSPEFSCEQFSK